MIDLRMEIVRDLRLKIAVTVNTIHITNHQSSRVTLCASLVLSFSTRNLKAVGMTQIY